MLCLAALRRVAYVFGAWLFVDTFPRARSSQAVLNMVTVTKSTSSTRYALDQRAVYKICVYGHLDQRWSVCMADMSIRYPTQYVNQTLLTGELVDQTQLLGVLNSLCMLGMILLSVECFCTDIGMEAGGAVPGMNHGYKPQVVEDIAAPK